MIFKIVVIKKGGGVKKLISMGLISVLLVIGVQGCTDEEAVVAGAIIGAVVGAAIAHDSNDNDNNEPSYHCVGGYRQVCREWVDHRGRRRHECREQWDSCKHRERRDFRSAFEFEGEEAITAIKLAESFNLGFAGAEVLKFALDEAEKGNLKELNKIGIANVTLEILGILDIKHIMPG